MRNLWSDADIHGNDELDQLVYLSRCIGADTSLVVWGGGNTSVKVTEKDFRSRENYVMRVKGSGSDMKSIERKHFPRLRMDDVLPLFQRDAMSDEEMVAYLDHCVMDPNSPRPSIETLLHAFLPFRCVAHSHADAVVALTNNKDAQQVLERVYGQGVAVVPYIRPGFQLSKLVGLAVQDSPKIKGVVLVNHGLFTWGDTPQIAYDQHIELVSKAEEFASSGGRDSPAPAADPTPDPLPRREGAPSPGRDNSRTFGAWAQKPLPRGRATPGGSGGGADTQGSAESTATGSVAV